MVNGEGWKELPPSRNRLKRVIGLQTKICERKLIAAGADLRAGQTIGWICCPRNQSARRQFAPPESDNLHVKGLKLAGCIEAELLESPDAKNTSGSTAAMSEMEENGGALPVSLPSLL